MARVVVLGAGSVEFARNIVRVETPLATLDPDLLSL
jgi:hypothetical protein